MAILVLLCASLLAREEVWMAGSGQVEKKQREHVIVIDPGHGGNDPGKIGVDGTQEKDLNLVIAKKLQTLFEQQDMQVILTRDSDAGLYDADASNKKVQDMKRRVSLINETNPACVISIHQNSYHEEAIHGAQVFYYSTSTESEKLAESVQEHLIRGVDKENHRVAKGNDSYYLLKKTENPIVIVECGFLSNWEESANLKDDTYQERLVRAVYLGTMSYLNRK